LFLSAIFFGPEENSAMLFRAEQPIKLQKKHYSPHKYLHLRCKLHSVLNLGVWGMKLWRCRGWTYLHARKMSANPHPFTSNHFLRLVRYRNGCKLTSTSLILNKKTFVLNSSVFKARPCLIKI
jgi:hypothetical protein